jgi:hypothetical protein
MNVNAKIIPNCSRNWGGGNKGEQRRGVNSRMIYLVHCKNLCKCHNVPPPSTIIKGKKDSYLGVKSPIYDKYLGFSFLLAKKAKYSTSHRKLQDDREQVTWDSLSAHLKTFRNICENCIS